MATTTETVNGTNSASPSPRVSKPLSRLAIDNARTSSNGSPKNASSPVAASPRVKTPAAAPASPLSVFPSTEAGASTPTKAAVAELVRRVSRNEGEVRRRRNHAAGA